MMITTTMQRMRRRIWLLGGVCALLLIATVVFGSLYFAKIGENRQTYQAVFDTSLDHSIALMDQYIQADMDKQLRYRELIGEYSMCCQLSYLAAFPQQQQVQWNELYTASIKLPDEVQKYFPDILAALRAVGGDDPQAGYDMLAETMAKFDTQNYTHS